MDNVKLVEAVTLLEPEPKVLALALKIADLLSQDVRIFSHGPDSVVFNWTHGKNNLYLTVSETDLSMLLSSPERIELRST